MRCIAILPFVTALVAAADYSAVDPPPAPASYPAEKPAALPLPKGKLLLLAKLIEALQGYGGKLPAPLQVDDGVLVENEYPAADLSKLLALLHKIPPKKYAPKATIKILDKLPGIYGNPPSYAAKPSPLAYKGLGLLSALAPPHVSLLYPPALSGYHLAGPSAPAVSLNPSAVYGIPGYAPSALPAYNLPLSSAPKLPPSSAGVYAVPGYAPPALDLLSLLKALLTKEVLTELLKKDAYAPEPAPVEEIAASAAYAPKPKKPVVKVVAAAPEKTPSYTSAKVKVVPAAVKVKPVVKTVSYAKKVSVPAAAASYPAASPAAPASYPAAPVEPVVVAAGPAPASYAAEVALPVTAAPTYAAVATEAPAIVYSGVEARSDGESKVQAEATRQSQAEGGESARASLSDQAISSPQVIS